jgi:hypothetical protein
MGIEPKYGHFVLRRDLTLPVFFRSAAGIHALFQGSAAGNQG